MKRSLALAALAGTLMFSSTASAEVRFRGAFTITSVRDCLARYIGETFNSAFRQAGVGNNPNITSLSQLNQYSGDVYELEGLPFTTGKWMVVAANGIDNLHYSFTAKIWLSKMEPATILPSTTHVNMIGTIHNMGNDLGVGGKPCVAGFRAAYFRRTE